MREHKLNTRFQKSKKSSKLVIFLNFANILQTFWFQMFVQYCNQIISTYLKTNINLYKNYNYFKHMGYFN